MSEHIPYIVVINGEKDTGRKTVCLELALVLLYNRQKTAVLLNEDSSLRQTFNNRRQKFPTLPQPDILERNSFPLAAAPYDAVIIPEISATDELADNAATFITLLRHSRSGIKKFQQNKAYLNEVWELKKRIAATRGHSLNWVVCENNPDSSLPLRQSAELTQMSRLYGFRAAPPLNFRHPYQNAVSGISAQDKALSPEFFPELAKQLTYEDICANREILKLAEFIFS